MKYELDISQSEQLKELSERASNFKYPFKTGIHQKDLDMIECDVPRDIYTEINSVIVQYNNNMPIGIDLVSMDVGS